MARAAAEEAAQARCPTKHPQNRRVGPMRPTRVAESEDVIGIMARAAVDESGAGARPAAANYFVWTPRRVLIGR